MKAPFAWFETFRLDPPSKRDKISVQVARTSDKTETDGTVVTVREPVEVFGAVPEAKKALRSSWIWNLRPGGFRPRALILAEPVDHSAQGIARFELESKVRYLYSTLKDCGLTSCKPRWDRLPVVTYPSTYLLRDGRDGQLGSARQSTSSPARPARARTSIPMRQTTPTSPSRPVQMCHGSQMRTRISSRSSPHSRPSRRRRNRQSYLG